MTEYKLVVVGGKHLIIDQLIDKCFPTHFV